MTDTRRDAPKLTLPAWRRLPVQAGVLYALSLIAVIIIKLSGIEPGLLGFIAVIACAVLALMGVNILIATIGAILLGVILHGMGAIEVGALPGESLGSFIAIVGLIIILGAGVGEVATRTGAERPGISCARSSIGSAGDPRSCTRQHHDHLSRDLCRTRHPLRR